MNQLLAFIRRDFLIAKSYRVRMMTSSVSLFAAVVPVFFIAGALEPFMAESLRAEGDQYFAFILLGMIAYKFVSVAVNSIPGAVASGLRTGTLEALLATPIRLPTLLSGSMAYQVVWAVAEGVLLLGIGWVLGAEYVLAQWFIALVICALIALAYVPFAVTGVAMLLAFRTTSVVLTGTLAASALLGGVYYPTHVIPSWIQSISAVVPLTYGLRALRRTVLEGLPITASFDDLLTLVLLAAVLLAGSFLALSAALRYARRTGTLAQY